MRSILAHGQGIGDIMQRDDAQVEDLIYNDEDVGRAVHALKAIAHPLRLKILCTLGDQEMSVRTLVAAIGTTQSNVSQHLSMMRDKGILAARKDANRVYYRVGDVRVLRLVSMMRDLFCCTTPPN